MSQTLSPAAVVIGALRIYFGSVKSRARLNQAPTHPVALAAVRSKAEVLLLLIHCSLLLPLYEGFCAWSFLIMQYLQLVSFLVLQSTKLRMGWLL